MAKKQINSLTLLLISLAYIVMGFIVIFWSDESLSIFQYGLSIFFAVHGVLSFVRLLTNRNQSNIIVAIISSLANFTACAGLFFFPILFKGALSVTFGLWILINGLVHQIDFWQYRKDKVRGSIFPFWWSIISFVFAIILLTSPHLYYGVVADIFGAYSVMYGLSTLLDFFRETFQKSTTDKIKRHLRFPIPAFISAFLPKLFVESYNKIMTSTKDEEIRKEWLSEMRKSDDPPEMEVFVHGGVESTTQFGHLDIFFDGKVYSYGSYDEDSQRLWAAVGDGVLFTLSDKEEYLKFCISHNKKTIVSFGVNLTDKQVEAVRSQIDSIFEDLKPWVPHSQAAKMSGEDTSKFTDYASALYNATGATFYKFHRGRYKSYFVMGTNCVMLADKIIGSSGSDVLSINGIITPGAYYNYLNSEFLRPMGMVVTRTVYSAESFGIESMEKHYESNK